MPTKATYCTFIVHPDGNDLNGGGFDHRFRATGTDASQNDNPIVTINGSSITAEIYSSKILTVDGYTVQTSDIGNCLWGQLDDSASTWIQTGPVQSIDTINNRWNFSVTQQWNNYVSPYGTATEFANARLGGALATPGGLSDPSATTQGRMSTNSIAYVKAATYTMTTSDAESGGRFQNGNEATALVAYKTTPGDHFDYPEDRVIIDTGSTSNDSNGVIYFSTNRVGFVTGFEVRGNDTWALGYSSRIYCNNCVAKDLTAYGFQFPGYYWGTASCRAENCGTSSSNAGFYYGTHSECVAIDCTPYGFYAPQAFRCAAHGGQYSFGLVQYTTATRCVADGASSIGIQGLSNRAQSNNNVIMNCATGADPGGGYGPGNAFYNNTANSSSPDYDRYLNVKQLTSDPFNDAANQDYTLNDTAGGGAELAERSPKWGAGVSEGGPQQQQSPLLQSTGGSGGGTTVPQGLHSIESGINA